MFKMYDISKMYKENTSKLFSKNLSHFRLVREKEKQLQREENKLERKVISREMKEAEKQKQFDLKQQKRKEKHRGR